MVKLSQEGSKAYDSLLLDDKIKYKKKEIEYLYKTLGEVKTKYGFNSEQVKTVRETIEEDEEYLRKLELMKGLV